MSTADPMATVRQYIDGFNRGNVKAMAAICTVPMSIRDGLPPHAWHGPTACNDWYSDVMAAGEHEGATGWNVTLDEPRHVNVTGHSAYAVVPATMTFKVDGKQAKQSGAIFTVALRKLSERWRIAAWAWAKGSHA